MEFITDTRIPAGPWMKAVVDWLTVNASGFFDAVAAGLAAVIDGLLALIQIATPMIALAVVLAMVGLLARGRTARLAGAASLGLVALLTVAALAANLPGPLGGAAGAFAGMPWPGPPGLVSDQMPLLAIAFVAALSWRIQRKPGLVVFSVLALLFIVNQGYWDETTETLALVLASAVLCMLIGVPLGIAAARRPLLMAAMRPVLDLMQTIPTFVYLIPALILFGLGMVPGLIATVIFALPAPIRLTQLGVSSTPTALVEAADSFGATPWQRLVKVELPWATPQILAGLTQTIMLSLSMVVIAALVGADGLGVPVLRALNSVNVAMGFNAGLSIVLIAIVLDRLCRIEETAR